MKTVLWIGGFAALLYFGWAIWVYNFIFGAVLNASNIGSFGDAFGTLNALFSGAAFFGLLVTLYYQRDELGLQREELALQRKELESMSAAQEEGIRLEKEKHKLGGNFLYEEIKRHVPTGNWVDLDGSPVEKIHDTHRMKFWWVKLTMNEASFAAQKPYVLPVSKGAIAMVDLEYSKPTAKTCISGGEHYQALLGCPAADYYAQIHLVYRTVIGQWREILIIIDQHHENEIQLEDAPCANQTLAESRWNAYWD